MQIDGLSDDLTELRGLLTRATELSSSLIENRFMKEEEPSLNDGAAIEHLVLNFAQGVYAFRRKREKWLPEDLFAEPAWDMLLDLFVTRLQGSSVRVKSACIASGVPATTALRWLNILEQKGIISSSTDPVDHRVRWVWLEDDAFIRIYGMIAAHLGIPQDPPHALMQRERRTFEGAGR